MECLLTVYQLRDLRNIYTSASFQTIALNSEVLITSLINTEIILVCAFYSLASDNAKV